MGQMHANAREEDQGSAGRRFAALIEDEGCHDGRHALLA